MYVMYLENNWKHWASFIHLLVKFYVDQLQSAKFAFSDTHKKVKHTDSWEHEMTTKW